MSEITGPLGPRSNSNVSGARTTLGRTPSTRSTDGAEPSKSPDDVKISGGARALARLNDLEDVRSDKIRHVSKLIENPDYTDRNFEAALNNLFAQHFGS